ncbi:MAG: TetR/AcrR family transcriptional regulator [Deltaproteobacteria bacterium]|nr:TetR/AcrR family transcriptional regulator [Deltaproteobacteria bacterium]
MAPSSVAFPRRKPTQERSRATVDAIVEAAARVFEARGYAHTTTNHIAERAGVSIGSLYQYFPNKDSILVALLEHHADDGARLIAELAARAEVEDWSLRAVLEHFVEALVEYHLAAPRLQYVLLNEAPRPPAVVALRHQLEDRIAELVSGLIDLKLGGEAPRPDIVAWLIVHAVEGLAHEFVVHPPRETNRDTLVREVVTLIEGYLTRRGETN